MAGGSYQLPYGASFQLEGVGDPLPPRNWWVMAFRFYQKPVDSSMASIVPSSRMVGPLRVRDAAAAPSSVRAHSLLDSPMVRDEIGTPFFAESSFNDTDVVMLPPSSLPAKRTNDVEEQIQLTQNKRSRPTSTTSHLPRSLNAVLSPTPLAQMDKSTVINREEARTNTDDTLTSPRDHSLATGSGGPVEARAIAYTPSRPQCAPEPAGQTQPTPLGRV